MTAWKQRERRRLGQGYTLPEIDYAQRGKESRNGRKKEVGKEEGLKKGRRSRERCKKEEGKKGRGRTKELRYII